MADGTGDEKDQKSQADEAALSARLRSLGERLDHLGPRRQPGREVTRTMDASAFARGFRLSAELVAGVIVGVIIGWLIDRWAGTSPWGLIVFLLLGFTAGVLNVMRAAGVAPSPSVHRDE